MKLFKASVTIAGFTLLSRILGLVRDLMFAVVAGAGLVADSYFVAFKFPNMFRALFAEGAMNSAFVPIFSSNLEKNKKSAIAFAQQTGTLLLLWIVTFTIVMMVFMEDVMKVQATGFVADSQKFELTVSLATIMFPYLIFMVMNSLFASILNSFENFSLPAIVPSLLNIVFIFVLGLIHFDIITLTGYELAGGVLVAGFLQMAVLLCGCCKYGIIPFTIKFQNTSQVKLFFKRVLPVVFGAGVLQLNIFIGTIFATTLSAGSVSYLYYADRLVQFPLGVIGIAVGIALIPMLSKSIATQDDENSKMYQSQAVIFAMFLTIPATFAFIVMAYPIISGLFMYGAFDINDAYKTSYALQAFAIGLPAFVLVKVLSPTFFARGDTKTPMKIAVVCMVLNIVLSLWLMQDLFHIGLALATSISSWVNVILLSIAIWVKKFNAFEKGLVKCLFKITLSSVFMASVLCLLNYTDIINIFDNTAKIKVLYLLLIITMGIIVYMSTVLTTKTITIEQIKIYLKRK